MSTAEKDIEIHRLLSKARLRSLEFARKQRKLQPSIERAKAWIEYYEKKCEATKAKRDLAMLEYWRNELATRKALRKLHCSRAKYRWTHETTDLTKMKIAQAEYYEAKAKILSPKEAEITKKKLAQLESLAEPEKTIDEAISKASVQDLIKKNQLHKIGKKAVTAESWKHKHKPSGIIGYVLLPFGIISLILSISYTSFILAFVGLGLTFWGFLFLLLKQETYVKSTLLDSTATQSLENLNKILTELGYKGKGVYLPPKYLKDFKSGIVYVSKKKGNEIPPLEEKIEEKMFSSNPNGLYIAPPGLDLTNLFEKESGTDFIRTDLQYLQDNLPKLFIENLEIAQDLEINVEDNLVNVKITNSVYENFCKQAQKLSNICNSIGCPLCSSIACALTRATGKPIVIEKSEYSENDKTINVQYQILEE